MRSIDAEHVDLAKLAGAWEELWSRVNDVWVMHMMTTGGSYILMDELVSTYIELTGGSEADAFALTAGRAVTLQQLERELYELTESTRRWDEAGGIASGSARDLDAARRLRGGPRIVAEIERFLETHGDVGQSGEDLRRPALRGEAAELIAEIAPRLAARPEDRRRASRKTRSTPAHGGARRGARAMESDAGTRLDRRAAAAGGRWWSHRGARGPWL